MVLSCFWILAHAIPLGWNTVPVHLCPSSVFQVSAQMRVSLVWHDGHFGLANSLW